MSSYQTAEAQLISATSTAKCATFEGGIQKAVISASADSYISFDEQVPVVDGNSLFIKGADHATEIDFSGGNIKKVWAITASTANVFILGIRN